MTTYYAPDLTGSNPLYMKTNVPTYAKSVGWKIAFENSAIYESSLVIKLTDGTSMSLVKNVDYEVLDDDIDQAAMTKALLENPAFNKNLIRSVTVKSINALGKRLAMTYQEFYLTIPGVTFDDGTPLEMTPDIFKWMIASLGDLRQQVARVSSPVVPNEEVPLLLPFDINSEFNSNKITGEKYTINTVVGAKVIRPTQGAFFGDSVELFYNGTKLNPQTDYLPIGHSPLTERSTNKSGIFNYLLINTTLAGEVALNYHAVGGEVQTKDVEAMYSTMLGIRDYLNDAIFVTSETIPETPSFQAMHARLTLLEDNVKRLLSGTPTYADGSAGNAVTRPIQAADADMHWYTIASLYKVDGSNDISLVDQFRGRVYLPDSKISLAFTVDVNFNQALNPVNFRTDSLVFNPNYELFGDISADTAQYPVLRVVWDQAAQSYSGALLQVGVPLPMMVDRMVVENTSTPESCWILSRRNEYLLGNGPVQYSSPEDNGFVLPDGVSVWSSSSGISKQYIYAPRYETGYLAYAGSQVSLGDITTVDSTAIKFNILLPSYFPIQRVQNLTVTMNSADGLTLYDVDIPITGSTDAVRVGRRTFVDSAGEAFNMTARFAKDAQNVITVSLNASEIALPLATGTPSQKTDLVRYIRAKV